jgi:hypothetical protein
VSLVDATGTGMFLTVSMLFFTRFAGLALGLSAAAHWASRALPSST